VILGDQLDAESALFREIGSADWLLMMEVAQESRHVPSHAQRTALFLSAMRHFAQDLHARGLRVRYTRLEDADNTGSFEGELGRAIEAIRPTELVCVQPGEWRVLAVLQRVAQAAGLPLRVLPDEHFLTTPEQFQAGASGRDALTMEFFYREQRRRTGYLMDGHGPRAQPLGGAWNFDKLNRLPFGRSGPSPRPRPPRAFEPDGITREVFAAVRRVLPGLPGELEPFAWPVTRADALLALDDFVKHRLANFGPFEDAMWQGEPVLYHSTLSPALNLKLLNPRECCQRAFDAFHAGRAPLQSVEAFIRQIIGWREFVRGVYWLEGPDYAERNSLGQHGRLPAFYWTGQTDLNCLRACTGQVVRSGFAHHIQRLMIMGNFALISGVHPREISDWFLGMFVDGIDWVTLPNTLGMVMHADRRPDAPRGVTGVVGTKPYAASANYIQRMSNYCAGCTFDPDERHGPRACPFNVFYWDFLLRAAPALEHNQRMKLILKGLDRLTPEARTQITIDAAALRTKLGIEQSPTKDER
jgi:deoxyribodipyrimidine photolyase-related protein